MESYHHAVLGLELESSTQLFDEPARISITGAVPGAPIRVSASGVLPVWNVPLTSHAEFEADDLGACDPSVAASVGGTYTGVDSYGLWARGTVVPRPTSATDEWRVNVESGDERVVQVVRRRLTGPTVRVDRVDDGGLVGVYARPTGGAPVPGVLMLGGSGATLESYADVVAPMLASRGFAVLGVAYFGVPGRPPGFVRVELEYLESALEWLRAAPEVRGRRLGVWGFSIGSGGALLLATKRPDVGAVVSLGGAVTNASLGPGSGPDVPPWIHHSGPVPFTDLTGEGQKLMAQAHRTRPVRVGPVYDAVGELRGDVDEYEIEQVNGPVLVVSGGDDQMSGARGPRRMVERARERGGTVEVTPLELPGAGHTAIGFPPGIPTVLVSDIGGIPYAMGGTPAANTRAQREWWPAAIAFLHSALSTDW